MQALGVEKRMPARIVSAGNDELRLQQSADEASSEDKLKIEEPDHRTKILRGGAPESSGQAEEVKTEPAL
jgi:hypothetical protein